MEYGRARSCRSLVIASLCSFSILFISAICLARPTAENGSRLRLAATERRILFDGAPFSFRSIVPYWDNGFLVSQAEVEIIRPGTTTVRLYDASGGKAREVQFWFPGAQTIYANQVALSKSGKIAIAGVAVRSDGARASYIAVLDQAGTVSTVLQTSPYFPERICMAPDETIWTFSTEGRDPAEMTLRHYDMQKGLIGAFLPRSSMTNYVDAENRNMWRERIYLRCGAKGLTLYNEKAREYMELDYATQNLSRLSLEGLMDNPPIALGYAVAPDGNVFAVLKNTLTGEPDVPWGLFHLDVNHATKKARWMPVEVNARDDGSERVTRLLGADDNGLIFMNRNDWPAVFWAKVVERQ